jgi:Flp pilus assembly protein TadG
VAPIFAIAIIPVIGLTGAAIDYSRAATARTQLQSAIDAAALALAGEAAGLTADQVTTKGEQYFNANFNSKEVKAPATVNSTLTFDASKGLYTVKVTASASVDTTFTRILGVNQIEIGSSGEVVWGMKKLELALALDNTGSMSSSNKMTELKTATKNLINTLHKAAKKEGDVKIAIIPFATDVNVGTTNVSASWLDWTDWNNKNGSCTKSSYKTKSTCQSAGGTWTSSSHSNWNGCVWDRAQSYDVDDTAPGSTSTKFQPHQASNCPVAMLGLTDIFINNAWVESDVTASTPTSVLGQKVASMTPTGNTNVTIGMAWGWHALTNNEPLTAASAPKTELDKVVILLTDGTNTQNRWSSSATAIDARTKLACTNAKAAGIKIYTVRVIDGNASLLKQCATSETMYYDVQNAAQLNSVFISIAQNLANLRIVK